MWSSVDENRCCKWYLLGRDFRPTAASNRQSFSPTHTPSPWLIYLISCCKTDCLYLCPNLWITDTFKRVHGSLAVLRYDRSEL